jgi:hypothetical protein
MEENSHKQFHPKLSGCFIPLPSDPNEPLSSEQLNQLFPNIRAWNDVLVLTLKASDSKEQPIINVDKQR